MLLEFEGATCHSNPSPCVGQWGAQDSPRSIISSYIIHRSIHWTLLANFHFLHHHKILHCLKAIDKCRNMHPHLCALCLHACTYCSRSVKIILSIHWTLLSNFHFLHHPKILHHSKAITKYRNMHACLST